MILIDSLYVNNGGGKVLLDLLVKEVNRSSLDIQFLFDARVREKYDMGSFRNPPFFLEAGIQTRLKFYKEHTHLYSLVLTFGNVPPPVKLPIPTYTYLHNVLYLENKTYLGLKAAVKMFFKKTYIRLSSGNSHFWIVQTELVKKKLSMEWNIPSESIVTIPFFNADVEKITVKKKYGSNSDEKFVFLYVSNGENYKNHQRLFEAFEMFSINKTNVTLQVTLSEEYGKLLSLVAEMKKRGVSVTNLGILNKTELQSVYSQTDIVLFPSFFESFGLGLIEAAQHGLPVVSSDCDYVKEVIIPGKTFDPFNVKSIKEALEYSYTNMVLPAELKIENKIDEIISIFKSNLNGK